MKFLLHLLVLLFALGEARAESSATTWANMVFDACLGSLEMERPAREFFSEPVADDAPVEAIENQNRSEKKKGRDKVWSETWKDASRDHHLSRYKQLWRSEGVHVEYCQVGLSRAADAAQRKLEVPFQEYFDEVDAWSKAAVPIGWVRIPACPDGKRSSHLTGYNHPDRNLTFLYGGGGRALVYTGDPRANCARRKTPP